MPISEPAPRRPAVSDWLALARASAMTGRDRKTLMKDIRAGRFPNAVQEQGGRRGWRLLVQDLLDAGLLRPDQVSAPRSTGAPDPAEYSAHQLQVAELTARNEQLEAEVARLHQLVTLFVNGPRGTC